MEKTALVDCPCGIARDQVANDARPDGSIFGVGDITEQTRQVCEVKAAIEAAGGTLDDICRGDAYFRNMEHFYAIHKARALYFKRPYRYR